MEDATHSEVVRFNPTGMHFYVNDSRPFSFPEPFRDSIQDVMHQLLDELNSESERPITKAHIKPHTEITTVEWNDEEFEVQPFGVSKEWYSEEELYDFEG